MLCFNRLCLESCSYHSLTYRMVFDQGLSCCFTQNDCYFLMMSLLPQYMSVSSLFVMFFPTYFHLYSLIPNGE